MAERRDDSTQAGDDQEARGDRAPTRAGSEATEGTKGEPKGAGHEHRSAYGGDGGAPKKPDEPRDIPTSRR